jgi:CTP synthase (UTP-ammonia lyase)
VACASGSPFCQQTFLPAADHPFYVGAQYHPEYLSRPIRPSPLFLGFILAGMLSTS